MQTKYYAIGDIHGRPFWKNYLDDDFEAFFILGDYFDSYSYSYKQEMQNFHEIIEAAAQDDRLKLCVGNHDYHYLIDNPFERYSRYRRKHARDIRRALFDALNKNKERFNIVYQVEKDNKRILISHAGVSNTFMRLLHLTAPLELNERFRDDMEAFHFNGTDIYGDDITQSPLWIRPASLLSDALTGFSQIVGHTPVDALQTVPITSTPEHTVIFIDTFETESILRF